MTKQCSKNWLSVWTILSNVNGTQHITDTLVKHFDCPKWQFLKEHRLAVNTGFHNYIAGQIAFVDMLFQVLTIDSNYGCFFTLTERYKISPHIVSDDRDYLVCHLLARHGIPQ